MFFLVWRGNGVLCAFIPLGLMIVMAMLTNAVLGPHTTEQSNSWEALALFASAPILWFLGKRWNEVPGRVLVDPTTGQQVILRRQHSMFFIKMQYWGIICLALGVVVALTAPHA